jgi:hypothetical protein
MQKNMAVVEGALLQGICRFPQGKTMVFCGRFAVLCMVNVVFWHHVCRALKIRHVFELYF